MEKNLLLKEEEFHKLNAELELKTQELLKKVNDMMKTQGQISKISTASYHSQNESSNSSSQLQNVPLNEIRNKQYNTFHVRSNSASQNRKFSHDEDILPEASLGMGSLGLARILKAKLRGLQSEIQTLKSDYKKKTEEWNKLQTGYKCIEEERNRWQQQAVTFRDIIRKHEEQNLNTAAKLSKQEMDNSNLMKELETLKKELRLALQTSSANEVRLNRSQEELEKLRCVLQTCKSNDNIVRRKGDEAAMVIRKLEKQKMELLHGFKKQMQLIDNLKKQKMHLKAACLIHFTEAEFLKLLD